MSNAAPATTGADLRGDLLPLASYLARKIGVPMQTPFLWRVSLAVHREAVPRGLVCDVADSTSRNAPGSVRYFRAAYRRECEARGITRTDSEPELPGGLDTSPPKGCPITLTLKGVPAYGERPGRETDAIRTTEPATLDHHDDEADGTDENSTGEGDACTFQRGQAAPVFREDSDPRRFQRGSEIQNRFRAEDRENHSSYKKRISQEVEPLAPALAVEEISEEMRSAIGLALSVPARRFHERVFSLARAIRGVTGFGPIDPLAFRGVVRAWHAAAGELIAPRTADEAWAQFINGWSSVDSPLRKGFSVKAIVQAALAADFPAVADRFHDHPIRSLVAIAAESQRVAGPGEVFYLPTRAVAEAMTAAGVPISQPVVAKMLVLLRHERIVEQVEPGTARKSPRLRYLFPLDNAPPPEPTPCEHVPAQPAG